VAALTGEAVHPAARVGFGAAADAYERGRPDFARAVVDFLVTTLDLRPGRTLLDLGAGTGKLTRMVASSGVRLLALEPVESMWRVLHGAMPRAGVLAGVAEAIPLRDGTVDAATAAQAFHWFDAPRAIEELHRVLTPGARLALVWNVRDESVPWVAGLTRIMEPHRGGTPAQRHQRWREAFEATDRFTPLQLERFEHSHRQTREGVIDRILSVSFISALPDEQRDAVVREVRALLDADPDTAGREEVVLPYRTDVWWCERTP
jgi:ubiquinone/menaquinone biosynthesis C-methylase UbiE